ncbi:mediator of RNA polymerase II transcription subunit 10 isoform X2 [Latimeria chalumnae]|uniref:mediator of RNA polymerase II transcription subunit 10 isoform X1 n=1 Tax=Latimeria chalumnae TaxID=7897 RepID=UPI0006D8E995|nr:PREDICTED: mediator of RNA polymerase II transcription subunit 10 isoform X1 [Latimeria chalumnae]XP_014347366.1 PREDICTED: mediator of RNA polymerase II transcription subunit 10 isoform X2 [Latimeria chalumnae]|eukprot:XP_014347365.1 PREDICTED: mediator of RNA polymerase II transcription subunit 10 isoform X1 [Latimeria chalumnae]
MADKFDNLEEHLEKFVENIRQLGIIVSDFQPSSQTGLNQKLNFMVTGLQDIDKCRQQLHDINVPLEVFEGGVVFLLLLYHSLGRPQTGSFLHMTSSPRHVVPETISRFCYAGIPTQQLHLWECCSHRRPLSSEDNKCSFEPCYSC